MTIEDVPKIDFRTHSEHFEYVVIQLGLSNAPATFQELMNYVFRPFLGNMYLFSLMTYLSTVEL